MTTTDSITRADLLLISTALQQRIRAFADSVKLCRDELGELRKPDALIGNYGVIERLYDEQIAESQALLDRVGDMLYPDESVVEFAARGEPGRTRKAGA